MGGEASLETLIATSYPESSGSLASGFFARRDSGKFEKNYCF